MTGCVAELGVVPEGMLELLPAELQAARASTVARGNSALKESFTGVGSFMVGVDGSDTTKQSRGRTMPHTEHGVAPFDSEYPGYKKINAAVKKRLWSLKLF